MANDLPSRIEVGQVGQMAGGVPAQGGAGRPPVVYDGFGDDVDESLDWRRYLAALVRYKWLVLIITGLGTVGGILATRFMVPLYRAEAKVWIAGASAREGTGPITQGELVDTYAWIPLLRSAQVLEHVAMERRSYLQPSRSTDSLYLQTLTLSDSIRPGTYRLTVTRTGRGYEFERVGGGYRETGIIGDSVGQGIGLRWAPEASLMTADQRVEFSVSTPRTASLTIGDRLDARIVDRQGNFLELALTGPDPHVEATTLNKIVDRFVDLAALLKKEQLTILTNILEEQRRTAERNLAAAENELESFRVRTITLPSQPASPLAPGVSTTQPSVMTNFMNMRVRQEQLRQDRVAIESVLRTMPDSGISVDGIEIIPAAQGSTELKQLLTTLVEQRAQARALLSRYTIEHPAVRDLSDKIATIERSTIPSALRGLLAEIQNQETRIQTQIGSASRDLQQIPPRMIEEQRLQRAVSIAEQLYTRLEGRVQEARLAEVSAIPDVRPLDRAVPPQFPTSNRAPIVMLMGLVGSFALAVGVAILLDRLDRRVRYPDQVTQDLGLNILGVIPRVRGGRRGLRDGQMDQVIEALRGIRLNLQHEDGVAGPLLITITSPGSGDGKSFTSSNLALAFADAGQKTLLVDGDVRRGQLHRLFDLPRKPGLTEVLTGRSSREEVIQATEFANLSFISCGTRTHAAPELLGSSAMSQLLAAARSTFDVILVDSPPMGAGIDPFALGTLTGKLMLVLRTGITDREMAGAKLDVIGRLPIRLVGAVLNDVKAEGAFGYYYGSYAYHLPGYEATDEEYDEEDEDATRSLTAGG